MTQKILITSALLYANGPLHFGHIAGAYLPGDCYARFQRIRGNDVLYVSGSDEYGVAITLSAELAGRSPKEHVDLYHEINKDLFKRLNFAFDHYSRTTCKQHQAPVYQYFNDLLENGFIEEQECDQLYSEADDKFLADRYVEGTCPECGYENARGDECPSCGTAYEATDLIKPRSKLTQSPLSLRRTRHWFLRLDLFRDRLTEWLATKNWKPNIVNFIKKYIEGLRPRAITRDTYWGLPVPLDNAEGKVLYVWFDAPIGYISASMEWAENQGTPDRWKEYWCDENTKLVHFIGKDNIPFHAAIFPAMTMGQNQPYKLVDELPANEFYNLEGRKFSKSEGWSIDLDDFFQNYTSDQIRYTIAANAPETSDSEFTWKDFQSRCNSELLGKYGNLVNRTLVFAQKQCDAKVPSADLQEVDQQFLDAVRAKAEEAAQCYEKFQLRQATRTLCELADLGNAYFDHKKPWLAAKDPTLRPEMETTISCCIEALKLMALVSLPVIPTAAQETWRLIGFQDQLTDHRWDEVVSTPVSAGQVLPRPVVLFRKIEDEEINKQLEKLQAQSEAAKKEKHREFEPLKEQVSFDDFQKLDLRVGVVQNAERVPKSKRLLKLSVDLGFESRTIVSGISKFYDPDSVVGQKVIVVANLRPAKLMGIESQGMILAATFADDLKLANVADLPAGAIVS